MMMMMMMLSCHLLIEVGGLTISFIPGSALWMVQLGKVRGTWFYWLWKLRTLRAFGGLGGLLGLEGLDGLEGLEGLRRLCGFGRRWKRGLRPLSVQGAADHGQLFVESTLGGKQLAKSILVSHFHLDQQIEESRAGGERDTGGGGGAAFATLCH